MNIDRSSEAQQLVRDCVALARIEGLEGHARAAECRLEDSNGHQDSSGSKKRKL